MSKVLNIVSHSEEETLALARKLAAMIIEPNVVVLTGELGSGKTVFVKGLAEGLKVEKDKVQSPTFTLVHEYKGQANLYHFDLYRIENLNELKEIGWDDYLDRDGLIVVEWGEKAESLLPEKYYRVSFKMLNESEREIEIELVND